ncbi:glycosyltransferase [Candidatus Poseidoniaceae archaeon]|nr:glycosyltransferase [Candidatus Poseidoniaceae archaeon]
MEVRVCAVVPVLNEGEFITRCIDSLLAQTMPIDVLVLDGGSTDGTLDLLSKYGDSITVLNNPGKRVAQARNLALENISNEITHCLEIIGHSWIDSDHVERRVSELLELESSLGTKIGAIGCRTESGDSIDTVSKWVEGALASPIGSGGGQFQRFKGREKTKVPAFCLHNVEALREVKGWDERFITSQDSDLSMRLLAAGWQLWRSDISSVYMHKRSSLSNWWKMCHRYGFWRTKVVVKHPKRLDVRELLPLVGLVMIFTLHQWWWAPATYGVALLLMGLVYRQKDSVSSIIGIPICLVILHTAFTIGLFDGLLRAGRAPNDRS